MCILRELYSTETLLRKSVHNINVYQPSFWWLNAFGTVPTILNPSFSHNWIATIFVLTTKLNCSAEKLSFFCLFYRMIPHCFAYSLPMSTGCTL